MKHDSMSLNTCLQVSGNPGSGSKMRDASHQDTESRKVMHKGTATDLIADLLASTCCCAAVAGGVEAGGAAEAAAWGPPPSWPVLEVGA